MAQRSPRLLVPLLAVLGACGGGPPAGTDYNVLLISLDSTRRDLLGAYGYESEYAPGVSPSPNLDALAERGVLMEDAYATTSWTLPSHMTLLTGQPELVHAVENDDLRPDPGRRTLPGVLRARGYATAGFYTGPYLDPRFGFDRGFERYEACYGPELAEATRRMRAAYERRDAAEARGDAAAARAALQEARAAELRIDALSHRDRSSRAVVDRSIEAIEAARAEGRPFFVFTHFFDPHYDYVPPAEHDVFDPDYEGPITGKEFWRNEAIAEFAPTPSGRVRVVDDRGLDHVRALYAGELRWTDAQVGRLLDRLEELGLAEETLVVVTSDHGDEFFEHDGIGHRRTLFEEVVRVPLILAMPGVLPEGERIDGLVSNLDVLGTVLDLLGLPAVPGTHSESFVPLIRGTDDGADRDVLGRLVTAREIRFKIEHEGEPVRGILYTVDETFRRGSVKIQRRRRWPERAQDVPPEVARAVDEAARESVEEVLRWIDVERYPDEPEEAWSTRFAEGPPLEALRAFHDRYAELMRDRRDARAAAPDEGPAAGLGGLGYAGAAGVAGRADRLVLPPPGAEILRSR